MPSKAQEKTALREKLRKKRQHLHAQGNLEARDKIARNFQAFIPNIPAGTVVAGYFPAGSEVDCLPLLAALEIAGARLALPFVWKADKALEFRRYRMGDTLEAGPHKVKQPKTDAPILAPEIVIVPLIAFDEQGYRLGQGAGLYDRTLAALREKKSVAVVGLAYEGQRHKALPVEKFDQKLDAVITEAGIWVFRGPGVAP